MTIGIIGAQFNNKGAYLMLLAVLNAIKKKLPNEEILMPESTSLPFMHRLRLKKSQKSQKTFISGRKPIIINPYENFLRNNLKIISEYQDITSPMLSLILSICNTIDNWCPFVNKYQVKNIIDTSGFTYAKQWGYYKTFVMARSAKKWKQQKKNLIFLPQAFGPFTSKHSRKAISVIVNHCDLICPRDRISYNYLVSICGKLDNIKKFPDFTNLLEGIPQKKFDYDLNQICIIPNTRMLDKTSEHLSKSYIPFLIKCIESVKANNFTPFFLIHETADYLIALEINKLMGNELEIITNDNPLILKGIIGQSKGVIGSRYHGLVSALSQGIPSLGIGWSHKYKTLFEDYKCAECLVSMKNQENSFDEQINFLIDESNRKKLRSKLLTESEKQKMEVRQMWGQIFAIME